MARILFVNKGKLGGPSHSLLKLLSVAKHQHDVRVLITKPAELASVLDQEGIRYEVRDVRYRSIPSLYSQLKREKIDLVYANSFTATAWRMLIAAKLTRCKFVWHIREILAVNEANPYRVRQRVRYADQVITVSEACRQSVVALAPHTPTTVIYNGIELDDYDYDTAEARHYVREQFNLSAEDVVAVSVGTITQRKNQMDAVQAIHQLIQENHPIKLYLIGECHPEYTSELQSLIKSLDLQDHVHITGFRRDVPQILRGADIGIHTALVDPHPRAVLDGLGASLPMVAYAVDGVKETLVDGDNGYLVPVSDVAQLTDRIQQLIIDVSLRQRMGQKGRRNR